MKTYVWVSLGVALAAAGCTDGGGRGDCDACPRTAEDASVRDAVCESCDGDASALDASFPDAGPAEDAAVADARSPNDTGAPSPQPLDIALNAELLDGTGDPVLISNGVPFARAALTSVDEIALFADGEEIPIHVASLAEWPDGSVRAALLQFSWPRGGLPRTFRLRSGVTRATQLRQAVPVDWVLPDAVAFPTGAYLAASGVVGPQLPVGAEPWMADYDTQQRAGFEALAGDEVWSSDARDDGYYSTANAWYQLFVRSGDLTVYRWARREAVHYRDDQIVTQGPDVGTMNGRSEPRYLYMRAMEADYLLNGDPRTLEVAGLMADYLLEGWDPDDFFFARDDTRFWTERRVAFPLLGLVLYGRMSGDETYLDATHARVDALLETQAESTAGGFLHDLYAHDPAECTVEGTRGGSPFMTGLLMEALIAYHEQFDDERVVASVADAADWLWTQGWLGESFQYQIGCEADTGHGVVDLNLLIAHGFAFAAHHTGEPRFRERGMQVFDEGVAGAYLGTRKHYNQNYRSSGAFLWYQAH